MEGKRLALISMVALAIGAASARADMKGNGTDASQGAGRNVLAAASPQLPTASPAKLVTAMPSPCEGNSGLTWDGTCLWVSDHGTMKAYRVDPNTGAVVRSIPLPGTYPNGLAWDGSALWYAESDGDRSYKLDPADGAVLLSFPSPGPGPSGLEFDGTHLWCSDTATDFASGTPDRIYCMTRGGAVVAVFDAIGEFPMGMAFDGRFLWHSDNVARMIYKLNPADLFIVDAFPSPGAYPNDLAWDGRPLVVTKMIGDTRRVDLGFYPVSSDAGSDLWDVSTDGALLMANALTWVARPHGPSAAAVIFEDTFPSATIDTGNWTLVNGATVDGAGMEEPSAPCSLRLNGYPHGGDSVESVTLDLSSCSRAMLTYHYQRTGGGESPDADDDLIVEYSNGSTWVELSREPGRGPDMTVFVKRTLVLPAEALHADFRFRIRSVGTADASQAYDDWFVDDVKIKAETPAAPAAINSDDGPAN